METVHKKNYNGIGSEKRISEENDIINISGHWMENIRTIMRVLKKRF